MARTNPVAVVAGIISLSIAQQKEAIGLMMVDREREMTVLASRLISSYGIKAAEWGAEDAVQATLAALCKAAEADTLGGADDADSLWKVFCTALDHQVLLARDHIRSLKRGGPGTPRTNHRGQQRAGGAIDPPARTRGFQRTDLDLDQRAGRTLSPEEEVAPQEVVNRALDRLDDPVLRTIVQERLEGRTHEEIAGALGSRPGRSSERWNPFGKSWPGPDSIGESDRIASPATGDL